MVAETNHKVKQLITDLHNGDHIDDMTKKWLCQTPNPPRIPEFYTLTKIHKPSPVGRLIVSGCDGPTEKLSSFVDKLLQPIAQQQKSYLKDTTDFVNFIENTKVPVDVILVSMDVTSLYTNIPQEEGIDTVCRAYEIFYRNEPPIPTQLLKRALRLILQENSFQFNGKNYLQTHPIRKQHSWTPTSTKGKDSKETQSLLCVLISNQLRHFSIPILLPVTRKELKKASLKGKPSDSSEQTLPN